MTAKLISVLTNKKQVPTALALYGVAQSHPKAHLLPMKKCFKAAHRGQSTRGSRMPGGRFLTYNQKLQKQMKQLNRKGQDLNTPTNLNSLKHYHLDPLLAKQCQLLNNFAGVDRRCLKRLKTGL